MTCDTDILIVGGGLNGPTLALALAQSGFRSIVIDANSRPTREADTFDGRAYALARASQKMLAALGLWDAVAKQAQAISEIKASDGHAGRGAAPQFLHFQAAEMEEGPMGYMLEDRYLRRALIAAMEANDKITHLSDSMVVDQSTDGAVAEATLADGQRLQGRILIGADGRASGVAARAGIRRQGWDYGQTAHVCAVKHELPHNGIAHQFFMPSGPLAILPLLDDRCSIVWSEKTARAAQIARANDAEFLKALHPAFGDFLGEIKLAGVRFSYPLKLTLAERFIAPRLALVGDAAHGVHPIAGQGLNLGFRDIGALTEVLHEARLHGEDIASELVLERYQQWRRFDTTALALGMDTVNRLFSNDNPALRLIRDIGIGLVSATPALRRGFMRQAAGLTGDLPRLLQGEAL